MPLHHYRCDHCGALTEEYRTIQEGGSAVRPICPDCHVPMPWVVPVIAVDAKEPFQRFEVMRDVYEKNPATGDVERFQQREVIDSTHTMRRIEADSERRYRNGEGEPMRFRGLSQDRSNMDVGSFGTAGKIGEQAYDSGHAPMKKSGRVSVTKHGTRKPDVTVARGAGQSPLKGR